MPLSPTQLEQAWLDFKTRVKRLAAVGRFGSVSLQVQIQDGEPVLVKVGDEESRKTV